MLKINAKIKILAIGNLITEAAKEINKKHVLTVASVSENDPYGKAATGVNFEIEVYNHNIQKFGISVNKIDEIAEVELLAYPYKKDGIEKTQFRFLVNKMIFDL